MLGFKPLIYRHKKKTITIIDQSLLPEKECYIELKTVDDVSDAIKTLKVRGAPLIGVTAAYGIVLAAINNDPENIMTAADILGSTRPTAVNLAWAVKRMRDCAQKSANLYCDLLREARAIEEEDRTACQSIAKYGSEILKPDTKCMVYCNAGALATSGLGTALGIIHNAKAQGKNPIVYACETRPLLQGARLTAWELTKNGVETYVICDNMAATYMPDMGLVLVGADRIAMNGDTANKIGTYGLAIIARQHKVDFYVAAPISTFDFNIKNGGDIPIEIRDEQEIRSFNNKKIMPEQAGVHNPAFDVTPAKMITGIITERGIIKNPDQTKIKQIKNYRKNKNNFDQACSM